MHPNCFISVTDDGVLPGNGDETCKILFVKSENDDEGNGNKTENDIKNDDNVPNDIDYDYKDDNTITVVKRRTFNTFKFDKSNIIVSMIHNHGFNDFMKYSTIRMNPNKNDELCSHGGFGPWAKWKIFVENVGSHICVKLQSTKNLRFMRILENGTDIGGVGGGYTKYKVIFVKKPNVCKLESCMFPGKFIAVSKDGNVYSSDGSTDDSNMAFVENPFGKHAINQMNSVENLDIILVRHMHNKSLRINPKNRNESNGLGGWGKFAKWVVIVKQQNPLIIKLKSIVSGKFLRYILHI